MRAILVDPHKREVREVDYDFHKLDVLQRVVAYGDDRAGEGVYITSGPPLGGGAVTYLDDEGIFRESQAWFGLVGYGAPLAGYMVVLGTDREGNTRPAPARVTAHEVERSVVWLTPALGEALVPPTTIRTLNDDLSPGELVDVIHHDLSQKRPVGK